MKKTKESLTKKHNHYKKLHAALDTLCAEWIVTTGKFPSKNTILDLMKWSNERCNETNQTLRKKFEGDQDHQASLK